MKITALIKPNSKKEGVEVLDSGEYLVRVNAPPVEGKANIRVIELLAEHFSVPKSKISLWRGEKSKKKIFEIQS